MNNPNEIDKLLKDSFEHFAPDAPDVWQGISQGVQASQGAASTASVATVAKTSAVVIKAITAIVAVTGLVTAYVLYQQPAEQPVGVQSEVATTTAESSQQAQPEMITIPQEETPGQKAQPQSPATQTESKPQRVVSNESVPALSSQTPAATTVQEEVKNQDQLEVQQPAPSVVTPSQVSPSNTVSKTDADKPTTQTKDTPKTQQPKLPYNPNEGEAGFDKANIMNVFTPDNDGLNDRFVIKIDQEVFYHLVITDANGRMVFESFDKTNTWDGKDFRTGVLCQGGRYSWIFQYQFKESDKQRTISGLLTLIN